MGDLGVAPLPMGPNERERAVLQLNDLYWDEAPSSWIAVRIANIAAEACAEIEAERVRRGIRPGRRGRRDKLDS